MYHQTEQRAIKLAEQHQVGDLSSYVSDVSLTSVGLFHLFSDVDVRTAGLATW